MITQNFDGLPKFKAEFFNDILLPCYNNKTEPDSNNKDDKNKKEEDIIAVTSKQLSDYYRKVKNKIISTDDVKKVYLNQLINEGLIDYSSSKLDSRQNIYYPLVTEKISIISNMDSFDNLSKQNSPIFEKIIKNITKDWILSEIKGLVRYRIEEDTIEDFDQYVEDPDKFQILDKNSMIDEEEYEKKVSNNRDLTIQQFIDKYFAYSHIPIDIQRSNN